MTKPFADWLSQVRAERGLTQAALARALGLKDNSLVSRFENGRGFPSPKLQARLAAVLGYEPMVVQALVERETRAPREATLLAELEGEQARVGELLKEAGRRLEQQLQAHVDALAVQLRAGRLQLVWSQGQKLAREAQASAVWLFTPDLALDLGTEALQRLVASNLARGVSYRVLVPRTRAMVGRVTRWRALLGAQAARLEVKQADPRYFAFALETVLYDAESPRARLGLMVAPGARADVDTVLSPTHAARAASAFVALWRRSPAVRSAA